MDSYEDQYNYTGIWHGPRTDCTTARGFLHLVPGITSLKVLEKEDQCKRNVGQKDCQKSNFKNSDKAAQGMKVLSIRVECFFAYKRSGVANGVDDEEKTE